MDLNLIGILVLTWVGSGIVLYALDEDLSEHFWARMIFGTPIAFAVDEMYHADVLGDWLVWTIGFILFAAVAWFVQIEIKSEWEFRRVRRKAAKVADEYRATHPDSTMVITVTRHRGKP